MTHYRFTIWVGGNPVEGKWVPLDMPKYLAACESMAENNVRFAVEFEQGE